MPKKTALGAKHPSNRLDADSAESRTISLGILSETLGFKVRLISNKLSRGFTASTATYSLRGGEFSSLAIIAANSGVSQNDICRRTGLDKSAVVAIVDDLMSRKWIARGRSRQDKRCHVLTATAKGRQALQDITGYTRKIEAPLMTALTELERMMLFGLLDKIVGQIIAESTEA